MHHHSAHFRNTQKFYPLKIDDDPHLSFRVRNILSFYPLCILLDIELRKLSAFSHICLEEKLSSTTILDNFPLRINAIIDVPRKVLEP